MNCKEIREKCVERKTVLIGATGNEYLYLMISSKGRLVIESAHGYAGSWNENEITDWTIKPEPKEPLKLYAYVNNDRLTLRTVENGKSIERAPRYDIEYNNETK